MKIPTQLSYKKELTPQLLLKLLIDPVITITMLVVLMVYFDEPADPKYYVAAMLIFALSFPGTWSKSDGLLDEAIQIGLNWSYTTGILLFFGYATGFLSAFPTALWVSWLWITPIIIWIFHIAISKLISFIHREKSFAIRSVIIVGVSSLGKQLRDHMSVKKDLGLHFNGFFDDRSLQRLNPILTSENELLGNFETLADYVKHHSIDLIYIALPMTSEPRLMRLLDSLKDTTASIYFVPNVFMFDLIQARISDIAGIPVIAVCETPFSGVDGFVKRVSDIVLSTLVLLTMLPVMIAIAIGIKITSAGPILFKQRRYGLDGKEIVAYKFRSMSVLEDGSDIVQATRNDKRVTSFGNFLRKTSLDELPQFMNVLQGRMSVVGPRPHAVFHNELYRKTIKGYMIRHKVRPGITGWAQINGFRGQTETVEKMKARIDHDLDYLRNWSLVLDMKIVLKTVLLIFQDNKAY